jgi:hypothetical protein
MYPGNEAEDAAFENSLDTPLAAEQAVEPPVTTPPVETPTIPSEAPSPAAAPEETELDPNEIDYSWQQGSKPTETIEYPEDFNKSIEERYGKYGVKSGKELESVFGEVSTYKTKVQELEGKLSATTDPLAGLNDYQKKLLEYTKGWDGTNGSAIAEFDRLNSLDLNKMTDKEKLKEAYVFENRNDISREEASRMFELDWEDKYDTSQLDADLNAKDIERRTLTLKRDSINAARKLSEAVNTFRPEAPKPVAQAENLKLAEAVKQAPSIVDTDLKDFGVLEIRLDLEGKDPVYKMGLDKEKAAYVAEQVKAHFSNPSSYNAEGKEINGMTPKDMANLIAKSVFHDEIVAAAVKRGIHLAKMKEVKDRQPTPQRQLAAAAASNRAVAKNDDEAFDQSLEED